MKVKVSAKGIVVKKETHQHGPGDEWDEWDCNPDVSYWTSNNNTEVLSDCLGIFTIDEEVEETHNYKFKFKKGTGSTKEIPVDIVSNHGHKKHDHIIEI